MAASEALPSNIVMEVLVFIVDIQQLSSALLSCRHIYTAFPSQRSVILDEVFEKQASANLLQESLLAGPQRYLIPNKATKI